MSQTLALVSSGGPVPLPPRAGPDFFGRPCRLEPPQEVVDWQTVPLSGLCRTGLAQAKPAPGLVRHAHRKKLADFSVRHRAVRLHIVASVRIDHPKLRENKNGIKSNGASRDLRRHYGYPSGLSICNFVCRKQSNHHPERWPHEQFLHRNFHNENRSPNSHIDLCSAAPTHLRYPGCPRNVGRKAGYP